MRAALFAFVILAACGNDRAAAPDAVPVESHALGMSDVSILLPLPASADTPVLSRIDAIVDRTWFEAFVIDRRDVAPKSGAQIAIDQFQLVAVRVDLCDRSVTGPCPDHVDGRLRMVAQPIVTNGSNTVIAEDVAVHLFYPIPAADLPGVISELRALARIQDLPPDSPLVVSPGAAKPAYVERLRALVAKYATPDQLVRFTMIGQEANSGAFAWHFRGLDRDGVSFDRLLIPSVAAYQQNVLLAGGDVVFNIDFTADIPSGFATAINGALFDPASPDQQRAAVDVLAAVENPAIHGSNDLQCASCHVATYLGPLRAAKAGVDLAAMPSAFHTPRNVAVDTLANQDSRVVRAFGWVDNHPAISQVVANATAELLDEIDARFPPP